MRALNSLIITLLTLSLSTQAFAIDKCKVVKAMDQGLNQDKDSLVMLKKIHHEILEAKELKRRIIDGENIREVGILAEAIEEEVQGIETYDEKVKKGLVVSTGSAMLALYIWTRVNRDTRGINLGKRIFKSVVTTQGKLLKKISVNMVLIVSIASTFWLSRQLINNHNRRSILAGLIVKINKIKDLTGEILMLTNKIDNDQVLLDMKIEELEDEGVIAYSDGDIHCID
ncbi:MAG: hypothetical protein HN576_07420 [Bacteriovoracaceae bacterium]|nr:hypothetical protein [Bacteriovoracaceae bacterium]